MSQWDNEGVAARFCELVDGGQSFSIIAATLNDEFGTTLSRSACIARSSRLGLARRSPSHPAKYKLRVSRKRGGDGGLINQIKSKVIPAPVEREIAPPIVDEQIPIEQRKTIFELTSETCRWPVGEGASLFFCGAEPVDGRPYCGAHCARAYSSRESGGARPQSSANLRRWRFGSLGALANLDGEAA